MNIISNIFFGAGSARDLKIAAKFCLATSVIAPAADAVSSVVYGRHLVTDVVSLAAAPIVLKNIEVETYGDYQDLAIHFAMMGSCAFIAAEGGNTENEPGCKIVKDHSAFYGLSMHELAADYDL